MLAADYDRLLTSACHQDFIFMCFNPGHELTHPFIGARALDIAPGQGSVRHLVRSGNAIRRVAPVPVAAPGNVNDEDTVYLTQELIAPSLHTVHPSASASARQKRILLLSVSAGAGHMRAAEAIRAHAAMHDAAIAATHIDVMDHVPAGFRKIYTDFYIALVNRHPALWGYLYQITNDAQPDSVLQKLRRGIERLNTRRLLKEIAAFQPDAIVCTHFLPAEILAHMTRKARISCPVWVQVTDFDLHRMWVQQDITGYFAANEEVAFRLRAMGIPPHTAHVTGIPIMPAFAEAPKRNACAHELGIDLRRMTVLLMGGGAGLGSLSEVAARLLALEEDFQLIVLAGKNIDALAELQKLAGQHPGRLLAQGYTERVERLMACADLVVTKPGGLTTSECLAMGLPMIVNSPIPGQEERNADYLLEQGVALKANDAIALEYRIRHLLQHPEKLADMRNKARALGRPAAARTVLSIILENQFA